MRLTLIIVTIVLALSTVAVNSSIKSENDRVVINATISSYKFHPYGINSDEEWRHIVDSLIGLTFSEVWVDKWDVNSWPAVIHTVLTRMHSAGFPYSMEGVIYQRNENRPGRIKYQYDGVGKDLFHNVPQYAYDEIKTVVIAVLMDQIANPCPGAILYYNPDIIKIPPEWAKSENFVCKVGSHLFYTG